MADATEATLPDGTPMEGELCRTCYGRGYIEDATGESRVLEAVDCPNCTPPLAERCRQEAKSQNRAPLDSGRIRARDLLLKVADALDAKDAEIAQLRGEGIMKSLLPSELVTEAEVEAARRKCMKDLERENKTLRKILEARARQVSKWRAQYEEQKAEIKRLRAIEERAKEYLTGVRPRIGRAVAHWILDPEKLSTLEAVYGSDWR